MGVTIRVEFPPPSVANCDDPKYDLIYQRVDVLGFTPRVVTPRPNEPDVQVSSFPHMIDVAFNGTITCKDKVEYFNATIFTGKGSKLACNATVVTTEQAKQLVLVNHNLT